MSGPGSGPYEAALERRFVEHAAILNALYRHYGALHVTLKDADTSTAEGQLAEFRRSSRSLPSDVHAADEPLCTNPDCPCAPPGSDRSETPT